jgi:hypothetical protein
MAINDSRSSAVISGIMSELLAYHTRQYPIGITGVVKGSLATLEQLQVS